MSDPIRHDDLTEPSTLLAAYKLTCLITHVLDGEPALPTLIAAAAALMCVCTEHGLQVEAVIEQVQDAYLAGAMQIPEDESDLIEAPFNIIH